MSTQNDGHPAPSERARTLVRGAVDYHVHVAPDFVARRITDLELARRCLETGLAGFGLKSHYAPTTERAQVVAAAVPGVVVLGTVTLNRAVGGLNALAVEVAARQGARIVWFPTVSSVNEQDEVLRPGAHAKVPVWVEFDPEKIKHVIFNLIDNALKYTEKGSIAVRVHCDGREAVFEVVDTGMGIPPGDATRLFGKYERGELVIDGLWWEKGVKPTKARRAALDEALQRLARFIGADRVRIEPR